MIENPALFGGDATAGIVAVEFAEPDEVRVFVRRADGSTEVVVDRLKPFLWSDRDGVEQAGSLGMDRLAVFASWAEFQAARTELSRSGAAFHALNDPVQQYLTSTGRTLFGGMDFPDVRRMQIDIETQTSGGFEFSNAERDPIVAIAMSDSSGWEEFLLVDESVSERVVLEELTRRIQERDPDVIEGHNFFKFDLPYLAARAKRQKVRLAWGRDGSVLRSRPSRLQIAEKTIQFPRFAVHGRHIVDTWILSQFYDVSTRELDSFGLKTVARHFGVAEVDRVILDGGEIQRAAREDPERLRTYALQDVRETRALSGILSRSYFVQAQIFPYNFQDVILRGNATKIDALFLREYLRNEHSIPDTPEPRPFEGGYTDVFVTGVIPDVWHCDVTSLYPSVMLAFDLLPRNDALGVFRGLLSDLRTFRLEAKRALANAESAAEHARLDAMQSTFKILINSFYGYMGFAQGHFADFDAASAVTARGREILRSMVSWLEGEGARVIEIDTDGIYFQPAAGMTASALEKGIESALPAGIDVEFDRTYAAMFSYKAKNYALLHKDGAISVKGAALKSRGMEPYLRDFLRDVIRCLLEGRSEEIGTLQRALSDALRAREVPIAQLAKTEALQDSPAAYQKKISSSSRNRSAAFELALRSDRDYQAGDVVSYYITGTRRKVTAYEHAKFVSEWDPAQPDENVEYYVAKLEELAKKFVEFGGGDVQPDLL